MNKSIVYFSLFLSLFALISCKSNDSETKNPKDSIESTVPDNVEISYEEYAAEINADDSLLIANSMFYTNEAGESVKVILFFRQVGDSSELVKMQELMVKDPSGVISTNEFYYKAGKKTISRQFFPESEGDSLYFVELSSFYNNDEKVLITKRRTSPWEELLHQETYTKVANKACRDDRAFSVVNQEGNFETTFQGFVDMNPYLYLLVGENKKEGYTSALIVQSRTNVVRQLQANESEMIGTPLVVNFDVIQEGPSEQQILLGVDFK